MRAVFYVFAWAESRNNADPLLNREVVIVNGNAFSPALPMYIQIVLIPIPRGYLVVGPYFGAIKH